MEEATGFNHRQILRWHKKNGLHPAGAYLQSAGLHRLALAVRAGQANPRPGHAGHPSLREQKARKAKVEADLAEGRVVPKEQHIRTLMTQAAWLVQLLSEAKAEEWGLAARRPNGLLLRQMYLDAFGAPGEQWCAFPAEVSVHRQPGPSSKGWV